MPPLWCGTTACECNTSREIGYCLYQASLMQLPLVAAQQFLQGCCFMCCLTSYLAALCRSVIRLWVITSLARQAGLCKRVRFNVLALQHLSDSCKRQPLYVCALLLWSRTSSWVAKLCYEALAARLGGSCYAHHSCFVVRQS
jgi:hypothetical protein